MDLGDLTPAVVTILLIGILLGIGMFVMAQVRTNVATDYTGADNNVNVSATGADNTTTLGDASKDDYSLSSVDSIVKSSDGTTLPTANYSSSSDGTVTFTAATASAADYVVNITSTYTYDAANSPEEAIGDSVDGLNDFAGWIAVIVVVIAAAVVLGIVLKNFGAERVA